ncbi:27 kDa glycoprotein-like [Cydia pomonella]|uniref:27 kDa glycoprotein-like n=1 Tax=Cydia pomonella TaxID=82600 RepID=UPI002ADE8B92|nr:27 kDa glycoprotein-like [Cydia pomonella]
MLVKFALAAVMAIGVLGRTVPERDRFFTSAYCGSGNIQQARDSVSTFDQCLKDIYTEESFTNEVTLAQLNNNQDKIVKAFCDRSSQLKACSQPLITNISPCFTATELRIYQQQFYKIVDFFCGNDAAKAISFVKEGGYVCLEQANFASCRNNTQSEITRLIDVYGSGPAIPEKERCKIDQQENACETAIMKDCAKPNLDKIIDELVNAVDIKCEE